MSHLPVWFTGLTPELRRKAEVSLGETPEVKEKGLRDIRRLIDEQQGVYSRLDEVFLLRFLRTKKYDVQKSFKLLLNYYAFRVKQSGVFIGKKPSDVRKIIEMNNILYAPYRVPSGSHVAIYRLGAFDVNLATAQELVSTVLLIGEMILDCEATQVCGGIIVIDMKGMTIQHYRQFITMPFISFVISIVQDCLPERLKAVHFVNEPFLLHAIYKVIKPMLKRKIKERIQFHGRDLNSLNEHVPKDFLPEELGGNLGPFDNTEFASYFFSQEAFIENINKYGIKEKSATRK